MPYYRKILGMTQAELAELLQVHRTYISAIERGRRFPSLRVLYRLADALEVEVWKLFFDE